MRNIYLSARISDLRLRFQFANLRNIRRNTKENKIFFWKMSRIRFWNETQNAMFVRKTFYKNRFFGTRKMIKNVVKIFSSSQIFCLEVENFPTSHVKFSKFTRRFCQLHTSSWPTRHVEFLHKTRLITHFMQSYLCSPLLKSLILSKTLCALRIEKIQSPLVSLANKRFSAGQFLQKSWQT